MTNVGVIGIGAMGLPMAQRLFACGHRVAARDVRNEAEQAARAAGLAVCASPAALALQCEVVIVVVADAAQVETVLFGDDGVAAANGARTVLLCPTIGPDDTARFAARLATHGIETIDAPVSGGPARALAGTLSMMLAAPAGPLARWESLLADMAAHRFVIGSVCGDAAKAKLVNNLLAGIHLVAAAEAMALAEKLGLDADIVARLVNASSGASWMFSDRMPRALARDYDPPRAATRILTKDLTLATALAASVGHPSPLGDAALARLGAAVNAGDGERDDASVIETYRRRTGGE